MDGNGGMGLLLIVIVGHSLFPTKHQQVFYFCFLEFQVGKRARKAGEEERKVKKHHKNMSARIGWLVSLSETVTITNRTNLTDGGRWEDHLSQKGLSKGAMFQKVCVPSFPPWNGCHEGGLSALSTVKIKTCKHTRKRSEIVLVLES